MATDETQAGLDMQPIESTDEPTDADDSDDDGIDWGDDPGAGGDLYCSECSGQLAEERPDKLTQFVTCDNCGRKASIEPGSDDTDTGPSDDIGRKSRAYPPVTDKL